MGRPPKNKEPELIHEQITTVPGQQEIVIEAEPVQEPAVGETVVGPEPIEIVDDLAPAFPMEKYYMTVEDEVDTSDDPRYPKYEIVEKQVLRREFVNNPHRVKCRIRAAKHYGVEIKHLQEAYNQLSGKKIDGIIINGLIDRFGFSNGQQKNRDTIAVENKLPVEAVMVADEKLRVMIQCKDVLAKYRAYLETFTAESTHNIKRDSFNV